MTMQAYIYSDKKYKPFMVYLDKPFPYGSYIGHYDTLAEAEASVQRYKNASRCIPLCQALVDLQGYDYDGIELIKQEEL